MKTLVALTLTLAAIISTMDAMAGNRPNGQYHRTTCAEVGAAHHGRGSFRDNKRSALPGVYGAVATCSSWEVARQEYNVSRDVVSIKAYVPERHLMNLDNGLRPEERNSR